MRAVAALALFLFVLLLIELGLRVGYPCDLMAWSEGPFMTHLVKLAHGQPIYGDPSDLNSYSRLVNLLVGLAAAVCAGTLITRVAGALRGTDKPVTIYALRDAPDGAMR